MSGASIPYSAVTLLAAAVFLVVFVTAIRNRTAPGALSLAGLMLALLAFSVSHLRLMNLRDNGELQRGFVLLWIFLPWVGFFALTVVLRVLHWKRWLTWRWLLLLASIPGATSVVLLVSPEMFAKPVFHLVDDLMTWNVNPGPGYKAAASYLFSLLLLSMGLLAGRGRRGSRQEMMARLCLLLGLAPCTVLGLIAIATANHLTSVMTQSTARILTQASLIVLAIGFAVAVLRLRMLNLLPLAAGIVDALHDPIYVCDETERVVFVNPAYCELTGQRRDAVLGEKGEEVLPPALWRRAEGTAGLRDAGQEGEEVAFADRRGQLRTYLVRRSRHRVWAGGQAMVTVLRDITERKRHEVELREKQAQIALLLDSTAEGIYGLDTEGNCTYCNAAALRILGYRRAEELIGKNMPRLIHHSTGERSLWDEENCGISQAFRTGRESHREDAVFWRADGSPLAVEYWSYPQFRDGAVIGAVVTFIDITERKRVTAEIVQAHTETTKANATLQAIIESLADWVWEVDAEGRYVYCSPQVETVLGYAPAEMIGKTPLAFMPPEEAERVGALFAAIARKRQRVQNLENWNVSKDGRRVLLSTSGVPILDESGQLTGYRGVDSDITEIRRAQDELRDAKERLESMLSVLPDVLLRMNREGRILEVHTSARDPLYDPAAFVGKTVREVLPEAAARSILAALEDAAAQGSHRGAVYSLPSPNGLSWYELSIAAMGDHCDQFVALVHDVTQQRAAEAKLRVSEERHRLLADNAHDVIWTMRLDGTISYISPSVEKVRGLTPAEAMRQPLDEILTPDSQKVVIEYFQSLHAALQAGQTLADFKGEMEYLRKDGSQYWAEVRAFPIVSGETVEIVGVTRDISERKQYEQELEQARDAAQAANRAKTDFLANMSHEIRTPLNAIVGMTELLKETSLGPVQQGYTEAIWASSESLLHLINDLLDISRIESGHAEVDSAEFYPGDVCEAAVLILSDRARRKGLDLHCIETPSCAPPVVGDANRIRQVLLNLLGNAVKFTGRGHIAVRLDWREGREPGTVELVYSVEDTGDGIPEGSLEEIFEKFVQLESGRLTGGAGLGLNISRRLATAMGGELGVESKVGAGSRFQLQLTLARAVTLARRESGVADGVTERDVLVLTSPERLPFLREALAAVRLRATTETARAARCEVLLIDTECEEARVRGVLEQHRLDNRVVLAIRSPEKEIPSWLAAAPGVRMIQSPLLPSRLLRALEGSASVRLAAEAERDSQTKPAPVSRQGADILTVDDDSNNRAVTRRVLEAKGYRVHEAVHGAEALEKMAGQRFDLVLMDLMMPVMDGFETTMRIRAKERQEGLPRTPVVAFTAHVAEGYRQQVLEAGMDDYLAKPMRAEQLLTAVRRWVDAGEVVLVVDDSPENRTIVSKFLSDWPGVKVVTAESGERALAMLQQRRVSAVLLDMDLPGISGYETVARIRQVPGLAGLPVVAMTGYTGSAARRRAAEAGCTGYLEKPLRRATMRAAVEKALGVGSSVVRIDPMLGGLVAGYLGDVGAKSELLVDQLGRRDYVAARGIGHNLKGTGAVYGFPEVTEIGEAIEAAARGQRLDALTESILRLRAYVRNVRWEVEA